jgi:sn-1 stearoyl-lipid 9-desaturase
LKEAMTEWIDAVNFIKNPRRSLAAFNFAFHLATGTFFVFVLLNQLSPLKFVFMALCVSALITVYNTVWYHRYCSHQAFQFRKPYFVLPFLWTNPMVFREEAYTVPHRVHHQLTEKAGDPYGPHLGWLGSYLAVESSQKINTEIKENEYASLAESVRHIGFKANTYARFKGTGAIENVIHYGLRVLFAQLFWMSIFLYLGLASLIPAWYGSIFTASFLIRDFNWHGHGGLFRRENKPGWEFDDNSHALNQRFYGFLASEWHDNHHKFPGSANNGFQTGQPDLAFCLIRVLYRLGIVSSYTDDLPEFKKETALAS